MKQLLLILAMAVTLPAVEDPKPSSIVGEWKADDGSAIVAIAPSPDGASFVGTVVWLANPLDRSGQPRTDTKNPDRAERDTPVVGLEVMSGLTPTPEGSWDKGTAYDPRSGKSYPCTGKVSDDGRKLTITVSKGPFHKSRTCTRVTDEDHRAS